MRLHGDYLKVLVAVVDVMIVLVGDDPMGQILVDALVLTADVCLVRWDLRGRKATSSFVAVECCKLGVSACRKPRSDLVTTRRDIWSTTMKCCGITISA